MTGSDAAQLRLADRAVDSLRALALGDEYARSVTGRPAPARLDSAGAYTLLYLERARLGLGAPFHLADRAQLDPRLGPTLGRTVAWALLARAARNETFQLDSAALGDAPNPWLPGAQTSGARHRALIDSTIAAAPSARTGEITVRLAYTLARAERLISAATADAAIPAAALARDRRLTREDAARLLAPRTPRTPADSDALALLSRWRRERRLASERPLLADDLRPDQALAARDAEQLLATLRTRAHQDAVTVAPDTSQSADSAASRPTATACNAQDGYLPCRTALRLAPHLLARAVRPDPYVTITLGGYRSDLPGNAHSDTITATPNENATVRRLAARARSAEALTIEWTRLRATLPPNTPTYRRLSRLVHAVAVAARPFAQTPAASEPPPTLTVQDAADRLRLGAGIARVAFDRGLDPGWRVPAVLELESAIADLRLALPALTLDGLSVRVGNSPKGDLALALHDPGTRTIYLPPASGAGTIAHELAHDLDWQTARTQLGLRGTYATDRAARLGAEPLATAVRALADTRSRGARARSNSERPAELFARGADWYVAAMLAREGRMNGALTSVQDLDLPGFAGATAPIPGTGAGDAIVEALRRVTPLPPVGVHWFQTRFGGTAPMPAGAVARLALDAPSPWSAERTYHRLGVPAGLVGDAPPDGGVAVSGCPLAPWQRRLLWVAADARARGMLRGQAGRAHLAGWPLWRSRTALGPPWRVELADESHRRFRDAVLRGALRNLRQRAPFGDLAPCL
jgi:hypothetical protein